MCTFSPPPSIVLDALRLPEKTIRRHCPFALPYPLHIIHVLEVESASLRPMAFPRRSVESEYFRVECREKSLYRSWSQIIELSTLAEAIAPGDFPEHEKLVQQVADRTAMVLSMPVGVLHPFRRPEFGDLPPQIRPLKPAATGEKPGAGGERQNNRAPGTARYMTSPVPVQLHPVPRRRRKQRIPWWVKSIIWAIVAGVTIALLLYLMVMFLVTFG